MVESALSGVVLGGVTGPSGPADGTTLGTIAVNIIPGNKVFVQTIGNVFLNNGDGATVRIMIVRDGTTLVAAGHYSVENTASLVTRQNDWVLNRTGLILTPGPHTFEVRARTTAAVGTPIISVVTQLIPALLSAIIINT
jgi:hypothetical protein